MNYNEFANKIKSKYPEYKDIDNYELANKVVAKYPEYKEKVTFDVEEKKGIDLTPGGLLKQGVKAFSTPLIAAKEGVNLKEASQIANEREKAIAKEHPILWNSVPLATDLYAYTQLPMLRGGSKVVNFLGNAAIQGGVPGLLEGMKQGEAGKGFGIGAGVGAGVQALPYVGKVAKPLVNALPATGSLLARTIGRVSPETLQRAVQADSKALDLSAKDAENLLMNTTERVRNQYNDILANRGQKVGEAINNLRGNNKNIPISELENDITTTFDKYQGDVINPARNMTGSLENDLKGLVNQGKQDLKQVYNSELPIDPNDTSLVAQLRNDYSNIMNGVLNNATNKGAYKQAIGQFEAMKSKLPPEMQQAFEVKFKGDLNKIYNSQNTISPIDLQKAKEQIGKMTVWSDETARNYKNPILEQIYGKFNSRLSDLSPEVKQANEAFAEVANFKKNEGLRPILKAGDNIDSASRSLKNYNSTVTTGNKNRNVQDLENLLTSEGYAPFLNDIDDVNAAMDLLNIRTTGDSWLANLATQATRPALRLYRGLNRHLPQLKGLNGVGRVVTPATVKMLPLEGNVEYNEYR